MKSIIVLGLVCVCFASSFASEVQQAKAKPFKYENCAKDHSIANITRFEILSSYPVSLSQNITASVEINLLEDIPENAFIQTNIYKITGLLGIRLRAPCLLGVGSCTTDFCKFLGRYKDQACPFFPSDVPCDCPITTNRFGGESITVPIPQLGSLLKFIASGDFEIEMKLVVKEKYKKRMIACYRFTGTAVP